MSQENVDRFLDITESFNRFAAAPPSGSTSRPPTDVMRFLSFMDPEIQFEPGQALLEGSYVGCDGVREWIADPAAS